MDKYLFSHVDIKPENTHFPPTSGNTRAYNELLWSTPRDIQLLGIGSNGHIAFIEPNKSLFSGVSQVTLSYKTRKDNARFFNSLEDVPRQAVTMSVDDIMYSNSVILIATGIQKAPAIAKLLSHRSLYLDDANRLPELRAYPADWLYLHDNATLVCDPDALSLTNSDDLVPFLEK